MRDDREKESVGICCFAGVELGVPDNNNKTANVNNDYCTGDSGTTNNSAASTIASADVARRLLTKFAFLASRWNDRVARLVRR